MQLPSAVDSSKHICTSVSHICKTSAHLFCASANLKDSQLLIVLNNNIICNEPKTKEKSVAPGGAQTHTSYSLGKHPNHLDHQHY